MRRFDAAAIGTTLSWALFLACAHSDPAPPSSRTMLLTLPRAAASNEAVAARVTAGVLPPGARIVVRLPDGRIAGTVTPYGVRAGEKAGAYTIPLPEHAIADGQVTLRLELDEKGGATRAPTDDEVESAELVYVPVSR